LRLWKAKARILKSHCRLGRVVRKKSAPRKKGRVIAQRPKPGKHLSWGAKVNLAVGKGP
jgi:beta-lactam-binding protein with PASTA domain